MRPPHSLSSVLECTSCVTKVRWSEGEEKKQVTSANKNASKHTQQEAIQQNSPPDVGNAVSRQEDKQVTSSQTYTHIQYRTINSPPDAGNEAGIWERNKLLLVKHKTRLFSKTHPLMLAMARKQLRSETGYFWFNRNTILFSRTHRLKLAM